MRHIQLRNLFLRKTIELTIYKIKLNGLKEHDETSLIAQRKQRELIDASPEGKQVFCYLLLTQVKQTHSDFSLQAVKQPAF